MMNTLIERFAEQIEEAISIGQNATISPDTDIKNIYVAGLGGSGIGGDFVANFLRDQLQVPMNVGKEYDIPAYVGPDTLCIVSSYSGNTEETLASMKIMLERGAKMVCIASGGKIIAAAKEHGLEYVQVPGNWPSPRACLGYSVIQQLYVLTKKGLVSDTAITQLQAVADMILAEEAGIKTEAEAIAQKLHHRTAVLYSTLALEPVTVRFRQQINENSKALCWHHIIPEMNHNELVGWKDKRDDLVVIYLRRADDYKRNQIRIDINQEIISKLCAEVIDIHAKGDNLIMQSFYLVHLVDWVSWFLAELRGVDSIEVNVIDYLKGELAKA